MAYDVETRRKAVDAFIKANGKLTKSAICKFYGIVDRDAITNWQRLRA